MRERLSPSVGQAARHPQNPRLFPWLNAPVAVLAAAVIATGCGGNDDPAPEPEKQASAETLCNRFLGRSIEGATVTTVSFMPAAANVPEHCVVRGEMPQDLDFELRLPTEWNKRTVFVGGGGFDGTIADPLTTVSASPNLPQKGYATIATNHGHNASDKPGATFALEPQMLEDYAYSAVPRVMPAAKAILKERYGDAFSGTKMVYESCSGGGRQGLIQAQRHPELFDGVISRAPANAFTPQFLWYQKIEKQLAQPGAALSLAKMKTVANAVMAKCDALDGLADNIIGRQDACSFDPVELACSGAETDACLTPPQVQSARMFYEPTVVAGGRYTWPGFPVGGEFFDGNFGGRGWDMAANRTLLGEGYMKYMVTQNPSVDWLQVDPAQYTSRIDQLVTLIDAVNPDLSRFRARGGKLLLWTGTEDWLITAKNATDYYNKAVAAAGGKVEADKFIEYYTSPGVQHCLGGTGADVIDLAGPMFEWLEKGIKPSSSTIIATQRTSPAGAMPIKRPLCQYPAYPKYVGGDPNAAESFICSTS